MSSNVTVLFPLAAPTLNETSRWLMGFARDYGMCAEAAKWLGEQFEKRWAAADEEFRQKAAGGFDVCMPGNPTRTDGEAFMADMMHKVQGQLEMMRSAYQMQLFMALLEQALFRWPLKPSGGGGGSRKAA